MSGPVQHQTTLSPEAIARILRLPGDEGEWQRACSTEQSAAHDFVRERGARGAFVGATIFGTLVEIAHHAGATFGQDNQAILNIMVDMFAEAFCGGDGKGKLDA